MQYEHPFAIPKNTTKANPATLTVPVSFGVVLGGAIEFPSGPRGTTGVRIFRGLLQLYPFNMGEWCVSDSNIIPWDIDYELFEPPYELTLHGYNESENWTHAPIVRVVVKRPEHIPFFAPSGLERLAPLEIPIPKGFG